MSDLLKQGAKYVNTALLIVVIALLLGKDSTIDPSSILTGGFMAQLAALIRADTTKTLTEHDRTLDIAPKITHITGKSTTTREILRITETDTIYFDRFVYAKADTVLPRTVTITDGTNELTKVFMDSIKARWDAEGLELESKPSLVVFVDSLYTVTITKALEWWEIAVATAVGVLAIYGGMVAERSK